MRGAAVAAPCRMLHVGFLRRGAGTGMLGMLSGKKLCWLLVLVLGGWEGCECLWLVTGAALGAGVVLAVVMCVGVCVPPALCGFICWPSAAQALGSFLVAEMPSQG